MAEDEDQVKEGNQNSRVTRYLLVTCLVAATGGLMFGYDLGVSGGVTSMPAFQKRFFPKVFRRASRAHQTDYCKFDSQVLTAFTSSLYVAGLFGSLAASHVTRAHGRKASMLLASASFLAGAALNAAAVSVVMLILGRLLLGLGVGFANQAVPIYLSEMAPARLRGAFNVAFQQCIGVGVLSSNLINYGAAKIEAGWGWRLSLGFAAAPALIMAAGALALPDTPASLLQRGQTARAAQVLRRLRGTENIESELAATAAAVSETAATTGAIRSVLVERRYRAQIVVAVGVQVWSQLSGINVVAFYAPVVFETVGVGASAALLASVVLGVVNLVAIVVAILLVDRVGRRGLLLQGCAQMLVCQTGIALVLGTQDARGGGGLSRGYAVALVAMMCGFASGFGWSWGPLSWLIPSEIFPVQVRAAGQAVSVAVQLFMTALVSQVFLALLCRLKYAIFAAYAVCIALMAAWVWLFLPETKNIPINHMNSVWARHWYWRNIVVDGHQQQPPRNKATSTNGLLSASSAPLSKS